MTVVALAEPIGHTAAHIDDTTGLVVGEYNIKTGMAVAGGQYIGRYSGVAQAITAIGIALTPITPQQPESAEGTTALPGVGTVVDASHQVWSIQAVTNLVLLNGIAVGSRTANYLVLLSHVIYIQSASDGHYYAWNGSAYVDIGVADPANPTASIAWFTVPDNGSEVVNILGEHWTLGSAAGIGFNLCRNGVPYNGGWAKRIKLHSDRRTVYHENPSGLGWIYEVTPGTWSQPGPDPQNPVIPPVTSGFSTTISGTVAAGSTTIPVVDASKFPASWITSGKCYAVIEIGGESGLGLRGTIGVGGTYPDTLVQHESQVSQHSAVEGHVVGVLDTGHVWRYTAQQGGWIENFGFANGRYYGSWICPKALNAKVLARNTTSTPNTITIDRPTIAATTNANIYVDAWQVAMDTINGTANGGTINWNTVFPGSNSVPLGDALWMQSRTGLTFTCDSEGSFEFFAPYGSSGVGFYWDSCTNSTWKFAGMRGNWNVNKEKFGFGWLSAHPVGANMNSPLDDFETDRGGRLMRSFKWNACGGCVLQDCTMSYMNGGGLVLTNCGTSHARRVKHPNVTHADYFQWQFDYYFCDNCTQEDCEISCPTGPIPGFELYCCINCQIIRPKGLNAYCALNTCQGCRFGSDPNNLSLGGGELRFTKNMLQLIDWEIPYITQTQAYVIDVNPNSGNLGSFPPTSGVIDRVNFVFEDYCHPTTNDIPGGIHVDSTQWGYTVTNCRYQAPDYIGPSTWAGPQLLWSDAGFSSGHTGTTFGGNVVIGTAQNSNPQKFNIYSLGGFSVGNNVAGTAYPSL